MATPAAQRVAGVEIQIGSTTRTTMQASNVQQYWVIGGEFLDGDFTRMVAGTSSVIGPFRDRAEATRAWREQAQASRHQAMTRYMIATSATAEALRS